MAYALNTDVAAEFKNIAFTVTSFVTTTDVDNFITQMDALINSYVGAKYVVPITADASSVALMQLFCVTLVADKIKRILENRQATNTQTTQEVRGAYTTKDVMNALNMIKKGELVLSGATLISGSGNGVMFSNNVANEVEPEFEKALEQW